MLLANRVSPHIKEVGGLTGLCLKDIPSLCKVNIQDETGLCKLSVIKTEILILMLSVI